MKEELTALMHSELLEGETPKDDVLIWAVYGAVKNGMSVTNACKKYGISVKHYNERKHII